MAEIHLKAKLQAYSRAPFYGDYIRPPKEVLEILGKEYDPNIVYGIKAGNWVDISTTASGDRETLDSLTAKVESINCVIDLKENKLYFTDGNGDISEQSLPEVIVDGVTLGKDNSGQLYVLDTADGESIQAIDVESEENLSKKDSEKNLSRKLRAIALYIGDDEAGNAQYIQGSTISSDIKSLQDYIADNVGIDKNTMDLYVLEGIL